MKILFLVRSLGVGGAEVQLAYLARGLQNSGHTVQVVALYPGGRTWNALEAAGVACFHLHKRSRWDLLAPLRRLRTLVSAFRPHVIYSFMPSANVFVALMKSRLPPSAFVWGVRSARADWRSFYGMSPVILVWLERMLSGRATLVICNSEAGKSYHVAAGWRERNMTVVENGFDLDEFFPDADAAKRVRSELGVAPGTRVIGLVGRIDPIKDHRTFLRMALEVLSTSKDCEFWCVGGGEGAYLDELQEYARAVGVSTCVRWLGLRTDMRAVYSAMNVTCLTSLAEGFPNVVGESMACGTPCVAFDVGDAARIVQDDRLVVRERDHKRMAEAVRRVLADGDSLRDQVRRQIAASFSLTACVERTEKCLRRVAMSPV